MRVDDSDFGGRLKRLREQRGVTLREIANTTHISMVALEALERNDVSRLPGGIFSRAFVRSYAQSIGADPEATVRDFVTRFPHESLTVGGPHLTGGRDDPDAPPRRTSGRTVLILAIVGALAALLIWAVARILA